MSRAQMEYRSYALLLKYKDIKEKFALFQITYYSAFSKDYLPCL